MFETCEFIFFFKVQSSYTSFAEAQTSFIAKESASCETELDIEGEEEIILKSDTCNKLAIHLS